MRTAFPLTLILIVFASACQKDKECVPPPLAKHIANNWNAKLVSENDKSQEMLFDSDGSLKESKGLIFGLSSNPVCTWEVEENVVILSSKFTTGSIERYECSVVSRTCDQIVLDIEGIDQIQLNKK